MISVGVFFGTFVVQLPVFAVLIVGLILLAGQGGRLPPRSLLLARAGLAVMLAESLASMAWAALLPQLLAQLDYDSGIIRTYSIASAAVGFLLALLFATGVGLLVAALLAARPPAPPPAYPMPGAMPPGSMPPGSMPPGSMPPGSVPPGGR